MKSYSLLLTALFALDFFPLRNRRRRAPNSF
jgi:hypothetical protein